jgi:hypothetical protein
MKKEKYGTRCINCYQFIIFLWKTFTIESFSILPFAASNNELIRKENNRGDVWDC